MARAVLLLVFGLNSTNEPSVNLLAVTIVAVLLLIHLPCDTNATGKCIRFWSGSYYRKCFLSLSASSFILNLAMLAVGILYVLSAKGDQAATVGLYILPVHWNNNFTWLQEVWN